MKAMGLSSLMPLWALISSYTVLFVSMSIAGPVLTAAGAFAASLGYLNIYLVFVISILANLVPDAILYYIGLWGNSKIEKKYRDKFGLTEERMKYLENILNTHPGKALAAIKSLPGITTPGLILAGAIKMPLKKYMYWSLAVAAPTSAFYAALGYYAGSAYHIVTHAIEIGAYFIIILAAVVLFIYHLSRKIAEKILEKEL